VDITLMIMTHRWC